MVKMLFIMKMGKNRENKNTKMEKDMENSQNIAKKVKRNMTENFCKTKQLIILTTI